MVQDSTARKSRDKTKAYGDLARREDGSQRRVLYAEDQSSTRIVTEALLKRMGFDVEAVEDGELALEKARASAFDLILLDIEMPNMDGVTAARHIKASAGPCQSTPIMAMSAFLADSTEHSVWRDAFDSALPKPANSHELRRALYRAIEAKAKQKSIAQVALQTPINAWKNLSTGLTGGTKLVLAKTIMQELHHHILAIAACAEAADTPSLVRGHEALTGLAKSFAVKKLSDVLAHQDPTKPDVLPMLNAVANWYHDLIGKH